jgi:uncharacterized protein
MTPPATPGARPPSERTTVRRMRERGSYDRELAYAIIDEALVCHVGIATDEGPVVIPTLHARDGDELLLHGSAASRLLRTAAGGAEVCVTITLIDGLVLARSAFHHSVNYRSVVVFGHARPVGDLARRRAALDRFVEAIVPGRTDDARPPNDRELRSTLVLALPLDEVSVKVRAGGPVDEPEDEDLPVWAGVVPLTLVPGPPEPDPAMPADHPPTPAYALHYARATPPA